MVAPLRASKGPHGHSSAPAAASAAARHAAAPDDRSQTLLLTIDALKAQLADQARLTHEQVNPRLAHPTPTPSPSPKPPSPQPQP
jgi:hypothetical protein